MVELRPALTNGGDQRRPSDIADSFKECTSGYALVMVGGVGGGRSPAPATSVADMA